MKTVTTRRALAVIAAVLPILAAGRPAPAETVSNDLGWSLSVDGASGTFEIAAKAPAWSVGGTIGTGVDNVAVGDGRDAVGRYREIRFRWRAEGRRSGGIRLYGDRGVVLFSQTFDDAVTGSPAPFPVITKLPADLLAFRYGQSDHLRPTTFQLDAKTAPEGGEERYGGPVALFDTAANAMIVSPAADFMVAGMDGDAAHGISSGFNRTLRSVPAGYTHRTLLAIGPGINRTWDVWGHALTDLYEKRRPANDADPGLKYLGYWTDNGGSYYYHYDLDKGYAGTLLGVKQHLDQAGIPIHYLQLDSWWYPKSFNSVQQKASNKPRSKDPRIPAGTWNRYGGLLEYVPHPDLFPSGLTSFHQQLGVPLVTHNRWIDAESPYRQSYQFSGIAAVDPKWWDKIMSDLASWGVMTYEQDWNNYIYNLSPDLIETTSAGEAYMDGMAKAAADHGLTMQYCMILPRNLMQGGAKYPNLTTVRVSGDRLDRGKWREFVYGSRLASSLGVWPWTDVFRSKETTNMLVCSLSAGMVGLADAIGAEDSTNIFRAVRKDGVIIKPDVPATPTDDTFVAEAQGRSGPIVCATHTTDTDGGTAFYVFAFSKKATDESGRWTIVPQSLGMAGKVFAYDYFAGSGHLVDSARPLDERLDKEGCAYAVLSPVSARSGMSLVGDIGAFITRGRQRVTAIHESAGQLQASLLLAPTENEITVGLYAPNEPEVRVTNGRCRQLTYDAATGFARAELTVNPGAPLTEGADPVRHLDVTFAVSPDGRGGKQ